MTAVTAVAHSCSESTDPRHAGYCACGQRLEVVAPDPRTARNPESEREFLRGAERIAGLDIGWAQRVEDRILAMEREKGTDSYQQLGFWRCVSETESEGLDVGGWPMMGWLLSFAEFADDEEKGLEARILLQQIAAHGVRISGLIERLRELRY